LDLSLYQVIRIPKKKGIRIIHAPCEDLKQRQREYLRNEVRGKMRWSRRLTAFLPGRSIVNAAAPHVGKKYLVHVDIKDFFHHVTKTHVVKALLFDRYTLREVETRAMSLAGMDWRNTAPPVGLLDLAFIPSPKVPGEECLPQGSPLSPHLALLATKAIDFKIAKMLKTAKIVAQHTIYADGIFLSSDDKRIIPIGLHGVERILASENFRANREKFRIMRSTSSQRVCGIVVNQKLSVPKQKRREIRARIHNLWKDALEGKDVDLKEYQSIEGYLSFATHVDPYIYEKFREKISFVRLYLSAKKKIKLGNGPPVKRLPEAK